jgi:hypothetical protein
MQQDDDEERLLGDAEPTLVIALGNEAEDQTDFKTGKC